MISRYATAALTALLLVAADVVVAAPTDPVEDGVSHALANSRAARISRVQYALDFQLARHAATIPGQESLTFTDSGRGDLALDYRDGTITAATLNGEVIATALTNGHLILPATGLVRGSNTVKLSFTSNVAAAGNAFTRYEDRDDHNEYFYTLFVPMDASKAFPCFDQPDLKASFTLQVVAPADWRVIANAAPSAVVPFAMQSKFSFSATRPISTYLFAFAAGPFEALEGASPGEPTLYVRKSQFARAKLEVSQVQQMAAGGIRYFSDYFGQPFPFPKYDLVLIPGFPFGGMEHAGATFLNEDSVIFRTAPAASDYFRRNVLVLHETCHQWFGDLVTMRWFDDLWLKEGFAQYMAYKALSTLEPAQLPWKRFFEDIKPAAYAIDETQGTTPIFQEIGNLKDAKSAYGAIVYQKAPAVLKQLNFYLGEDTFRDGLRLYLRDHAYGNARWADLVRAFATAGTRHRRSLDVRIWANAWILQRGMPQVDVRWSCDAHGRVSMTLSQSDVLDEHHLWPIANEVVLADKATASIPSIRRIRVEWSTAQLRIAVPRSEHCPAYVFANFDDQAYGRFVLDDASQHAAAGVLTGTSPDAPGVPAEPATTAIPDPLLRSMLWGALWDNVLVGHSAPRGYLELVLDTLPSETDESLARIEGAHAATALHAYVSAASRASYAPRLEAIAVDRLLNAPTLGLRIVNFRTFTGVAETAAALRQQKALLSGALVVAGMPLRPLDRWNLIGHLVAMNDADAARLLAEEQANDVSGEGQKYGYAAAAGIPTAPAKARYFADYLADPSLPSARQEDWLTQSLGAFNSWNQTELTEPYLTRALDVLPEIKLRRRIFFLSAWLHAFIGGQHGAEAQAIVHDWLLRNTLDPDLKLKLLEVSDALDRTVLIRRRFPD